MITPTEINSENQIYLAGSPVVIRLQNILEDSNFLQCICEIYVWKGNLNTPPSLANYTYVLKKISKSDTYIDFKIGDILASEITGTKFGWISGNDAPSVAGEGVFFQLKYQFDEESAIELPTGFATLGYRWDYEQIGFNENSQPYLGLVPINRDRNYTERINYYVRDFDFTKSLETCTTENIITSTAYTPAVTKCQLGDKYLVIYLNRHGLFDYFTTYGKAVKSIKIDSDSVPRLYRDTNRINNNINHSKHRMIETTDQMYSINTGDLTELMTEQVEEVYYSPLVYLIEFSGDVFTEINEGLTVDNTLVTVDDTTYTADNQTVTTLDLGYFLNFKQIPVINENKDFVKKTRRNDKAKINYELQFSSTVGRINQLK